MKKYPERDNPLIGRVIIRFEDKLWYLINVTNDGTYKWLEVVEQTSAQRKSYVGVAPHNERVSDGMLDGERVEYPADLKRRY